MDDIKLCRNCTYSVWFEDMSAGIVGGYECDNPNIPDDSCETFALDESLCCPFFDPEW